MSLEAARNVVVKHSGWRRGSRESESVPVWLADCLYDIRLNSGQTDGRMSLTVISSEADNVIAPPHQHLDADELIYVLEGLLLVKVYHGDLIEESDELNPEWFESHTLLYGDFIWMPAGTIEALFTIERAMKAIFVFSPAGGSDEFFVNAGEPAETRTIPQVRGTGRPGIEVLRHLSEDAKFQYIPPSKEADG